MDAPVTMNSYINRGRSISRHNPASGSPSRFRSSSIISSRSPERKFNPADRYHNYIAELPRHHVVACERDLPHAPPCRRRQSPTYQYRDGVWSSSPRRDISCEAAGSTDNFHRSPRSKNRTRPRNRRSRSRSCSSSSRSRSRSVTSSRSASVQSGSSEYSRSPESFSKVNRGPEPSGHSPTRTLTDGPRWTYNPRRHSRSPSAFTCIPDGLKDQSRYPLCARRYSRSPLSNSPRPRYRRRSRSSSGQSQRSRCESSLSGMSSISQRLIRLSNTHASTDSWSPSMQRNTDPHRSPSRHKTVVQRPRQSSSRQWYTTQRRPSPSRYQRSYFMRVSPPRSWSSWTSIDSWKSRTPWPRRSRSRSSRPRTRFARYRRSRSRSRLRSRSPRSRSRSPRSRSRSSRPRSRFVRYRSRSSRSKLGRRRSRSKSSSITRNTRDRRKSSRSSRSRSNSQRRYPRKRRRLAGSRDRRSRS